MRLFKKKGEWICGGLVVWKNVYYMFSFVLDVMNIIEERIVFLYLFIFLISLYLLSIYGVKV